MGGCLKLNVSMDRCTHARLAAGWRSSRLLPRPGVAGALCFVSTARGAFRVTGGMLGRGGARRDRGTGGVRRLEGLVV